MLPLKTCIQLIRETDIMNKNKRSCHVVCSGKVKKKTKNFPLLYEVDKTFMDCKSSMLWDVTGMQGHTGDVGQQEVKLKDC